MSWLVAATAKGSLLIALALCVLALGGNRIPAKWRHALLIVALLRLVLPFAPQTPFSVFNLAQRRLEAPMPAMPPESGAVVIAPRTAALPQVTTTNSGNILLAIWATGALLMFTRLAFRVAILRRRLRAQPPQAITDPRTIDILDACRAQLGIARTVALATTSAAATPSLLGGLHPTLLLPPDVAESLSTDQLRFIFLHELAHLRRLDVLVNWFVAIVHALHWFNPLVWIAASRIAEERELACDAHALEHLDRGERSGYGETVIQLLDRLPMTRTAPGLVGMTATRRQLKRRILMIARFRSSSRLGAWPAALLALFALVTLTDARAGERIMKMRHPMSPAAEATMHSLDQTLSGFELKDATIDDVLAKVTASTGVTLKVAPAAIDDAKKQARIDINANGVPAHVVLMESLDALDLALDFAEDGSAIVIAQPLGDRRVFLRHVPPPADGNHDRVIFIERDEHVTPEAKAKEMARESGEDVLKVDKDGVTRRKVTFRGHGDAEGTLELEVRRAH